MAQVSQPPIDKKLLHQYEIHCPNCGILLRNVNIKDKRTICPDCGSPQAIFLPYSRFQYEWHPDGELYRIKEKKAL